MRRLAVTGASGQLGWEVVRSLQPFGEVIALDRAACDLSQPESLRSVLRQVKPDVVFNTAAYTAVDKAEQEPDMARIVNEDAVGVIADEARRLGALLIHYSTDYVFPGEGERPIPENSATGPQSVYGKTKLGGEVALADSSADWLCFRTSWVYSSRGRNFLRTVLRLACERDELRVVSDQIGAPTWCRLIADASVHAMVHALDARQKGRFSSETLHLTARGEVSWHGFAEAVLEAARALGLPGIRAAHVKPIPSSDYPSPAARPKNSRLDCTRFEARFGLNLPPWQVGLALCLADLAAHEWK